MCCRLKSESNGHKELSPAWNFSNLVFNRLLGGVHSVLLASLNALQGLFNEVKGHPERVSALIRVSQQLAERLPDKSALAADAHVGANQQEASPVCGVGKVFCVLHCGHRLGQGAAYSCTLNISQNQFLHI